MGGGEGGSTSGGRGAVVGCLWGKQLLAMGVWVCFCVLLSAGNGWGMVAFYSVCINVCRQGGNHGRTS